MLNHLLILITTFFSISSALANSVEFKAKLSPAGSFVTKTDRVKGVVKKVGDKYIAENIIVDATSLKSEMELRDTHMKSEDRLNTEKFPEIILIKAEGKDGKGSGTIKIKGVEAPIPQKPDVEEDPKYEIKDGKLIAEFHLLLSKFPLKSLKHMGIGVKNEITVKAVIDIQK